MSAYLLCLGLVLAACGKEPVTIPTLRLTAADQARCQRLTNALPDSVADQGRRKTQPAEALGGAWGDPAIIAQCGVGVPAGFSKSSGCLEADGVGWFVPDEQFDDQEADATLTAVGYRPIVSVTVPGKYRPSGPAAAIADLAQPVKDHLELVQDCK
jgi:hypothetical protein